MPHAGESGGVARTGEMIILEAIPYMNTDRAFAQVAVRGVVASRASSTRSSNAGAWQPAMTIATAFKAAGLPVPEIPTAPPGRNAGSSPPGWARCRGRIQPGGQNSARRDHEARQ